MQEIFAAARVAISVVILLYASWSDYKTRMVSNWVWVVYAPIALALSLAELLLYSSSQLWLFGVSVGFTVLFAFILFYTGAFGGADSKAFMCIALALPFFPLGAPLLAQLPIIKSLLINAVSPLSQILFPITILSNSVLIAALSAFYLLLRNLAGRPKGKPVFEGTLTKESIGKKILVLITGKKYPVATLKSKWHVYPMEDITEEENSETPLKRKLVVVPKDEGRDEIVARLAKAIEEGKIKDGVWATPGLPMLIFVTVGFVVALLFGDIIWVLVSHLF